jgi:hypothetical protein
LPRGVPDYDPVPLDFVQIKLHRCGSFRPCCVRRVDLTEDFTLVAKQDDPPPALHPAGELRRTIFSAGAAGRHRGILIDQHATNVGTTSFFWSLKFSIPAGTAHSQIQSAQCFF